MLPMSSSVPRPRVLRVDLERSGAAREGAVLETFTHADPGLDRTGRAGGEALALVLFLDALRRAPDVAPPFVVAAGECVRRSLPSAARASLVARSPLSGALACAQVGTDVAARLASVCDALVLEGRVRGADRVLVIEGDGRARVERLEGLSGAAAASKAASLERSYGACGVLAIGPAGERGVTFSNLAAGVDPQSFAGRGGLGAAFGRTGLAALVVRAQKVEPRIDESARELVARLVRSPRLRTRSAGGTLELFDLPGASLGESRGAGLDADGRARGDGVLGAREGDRDDPTSRDLGRAASGAADQRHGCRGCPTPCGLAFSSEEGLASHGARFSALEAFGVALGLPRPEDALRLLARCNELGLDARDAALVLARDVGRDAGIDVHLAHLGRAARGGVEPTECSDLARRRAAAARARSVATELGILASARGADRLRSFPFLVDDAAGRAVAERIVAPLALGARACDPTSPEDKGVLAWWHESFSAAVDASGFCAFSAASLLLDGVCTLEELARWIAPASVREGAVEGELALELLALGASSALVARAIGRELGTGALASTAELALAVPELGGALAEHARAFGLDADGGPSARAWSALGTRELVDAVVARPRATSPAACERIVERSLGRVLVRGHGALSARLGATRELALPLPARVADVLAALDAGAPAVWRAGRKLDDGDWIEAGDELDLVAVLSGG